MNGFSEGTVASRKVEFLTVDSGACVTIVPPEMFKHTPVDRHSEFGSKYRACGGETVTNLGLKCTECLFSDGSSKKILFQIRQLE